MITLRGWLQALAGVAIVLAIHGTAFAVNYTWLGGSGSWSVSTNWTPNGLPASGDTVTINGPAGTVVSVLPGTTTGTGVPITVRSGNTLLGTGTNNNGSTARLGWSSSVTNQGTIENASLYFATVTNTGTISANGSGKNMMISSVNTLTNTNGLIRAVNGGILNGLSFVTGGTLSIDSTSSWTLSGASLTPALTNVAATNSGTYYGEHPIVDVFYPAAAA